MRPRRGYNKDEPEGPVFRPRNVREVLTWPVASAASTCFCGFLGATWAVAVYSYLRPFTSIGTVPTNITTIVRFLIQGLVRVLAGGLCDVTPPAHVHGAINLLAVSGAFALFACGDAVALRGAVDVLFQGYTSFVSGHLMAMDLSSPENAATFSGVVCGVGNVGAAFGYMLLPWLLEAVDGFVAFGLAWRVATLVPALLLLVTGASAWFTRTPMIRLMDSRPPEERRLRHMLRLLWLACANYRVWILTVQYAASFGLWVGNVTSLPRLLQAEFGIANNEAYLYSGLTKLVPLFFRPTSGMSSDYLAHSYGMRGRLWFAFAALVGQGFATMMLNLMWSGLRLTLLGTVLQEVSASIAHASIFGILPFVTYRAQGVATGMVAGGGFAGGIVVVAMLLRGADIEAQKTLFWVTGSWIIGTAVLTFGMRFPMWKDMMGRGDATEVEEDYYQQEWSNQEFADGRARNALAFAARTRYHRGYQGMLAFAKEQLIVQGSLSLSKGPMSQEQDMPE